MKQFLSILFAALCLLPSALSGAEALYVEQAADNDYWASGPKSQRIQFSGAANVTRIELKVSTSSTTYGLYAMLHTEKNGGGTLLGTSRTVTTNIDNGTPQWVAFVCGRGGIPVTNDFWLSINGGFNWRSSTANPYGGTDYYLTYGGGDRTGDDYCFRVYTNTFAARTSTNTLAALDCVTVQEGIDDMLAGEVVILPAGKTNWPTTVNWHDKPLTIYGAGRTNTVITNSQVNATSSGEYPALSIQASTNGNYLLNGVGFSTLDTNCCVAIETVAGHKCPAVKLVRCAFERGHYGGVVWNGLFAGLVKNSRFRNQAGAWFVYADQFLDSWTDELTLGTTNTVVFEDNVYEYDVASISGRTLILLCDTGHGSRVCMRHETVTSTHPDLKFSPLVMFHGNQDTVRGSRQQEIYANTFTTAGADDKLTDLRGGTTLIYSNTFTGSGMRSAFTAREEDGYFSAWTTYTTNAPGYDPNVIYAWGNTSKGSPVTSLELYYEETDPAFFVENTDVFWSAKPGYTALAYPHPWTNAEDEEPAAPAPAHSIGTIRAVNAVRR